MTGWPETIALLLWLVLCGVAAGLAAARALGADWSDRVARLMAVCAAGPSLLGGAVFGLLLLGLYTRWTAVALPLMCCVYLVSTRGPQRAAPEPGGRRRSPVDRAFIALCALLLVADFASASTSPPTWWDAIIHWDKWAADWGRRTHLHNYPYAYPQALPMFASLAYKLAGDGAQILPASAFAVHALHPLLGALLLMAVVRLADAFDLPAWPVLLTVFGSRTARDHLVAGGVDLFVTTLTAVAAALALHALRAAEPPTPGQRRMLVLLLAGALAAKPTGLMAILAALAALLSWRARPPDGMRIHAWRRADVLRLALVPGLLAAPFYAWALYADLTYRIERLDPRELHYMFVAIGSILSSATTVAQPRAASATQVLLETLHRPVVEYGYPRALLVPVLVATLAWLIAAARDRRARGLLAPVLVYLGAWLAILSYDVRNLLPALPFLGLTLACGAQRLRAASARPTYARALGGATLALAAFPAWGLLGDTGRAWANLGTGPHALGARLAAMRADVETRIATHFADEWDDYAFIRRVGLDRRAQHVIAGGPMYRFFAQGAYPITIFWWGVLAPGDVYVNYVWIERGPAERGAHAILDWFLVRATPVRRTFVYGPQSARVPLTRLRSARLAPPSVVGAEPDETLSYDVLRRRPAPGATVLWQLVVEGRALDARVRPVVLPSDASLVDWQRTSVASAAHAGDLLTYGGLITLTRAPRASGARLLVGVAGADQLARLRLRELRVWVRAPEPLGR